MSLVATLSAGAFAVGLLGGVHCVGMCGGMVTALSTHGSPRKSLLLGFNVGRILSYAFAGAVAGTLGGMTLLLHQVAPVQIGLLLLANVLLIALGLYLAGWTAGLTWLERPGRVLWRWLHPLVKGLLPIRGWTSAIGVGAIWGWVPCGLVYSVLATALLSGSPTNGALVMSAFGLGTLPNLLIIGLFGNALRTRLQSPRMRLGVGVLVVGLGLAGLVRTMSLSSEQIASLICIS